MGGGVWMWWMVTATMGQIPHAGGSPASLGAVAGVYDRVYEIHSILWHLRKKYMCALGKVSVPLENLRIKPKNQTAH